MPRGVYDRSRSRPRRKLAKGWDYLSIRELKQIIDHKTRVIGKLSRRRQRVVKKIAVVDRKIAKLTGAQ